ncbi:hypothetical protein [Roseivirga echinicomitans]|uniref:STAS/SEC14 domain-containing protein n=1 Tax=Roseivirga echinicomitans TaxID=296218 RepID=A0A150XK98_9BACT|nr:hypothetical protein [Roseivirga echinicomitans]KYG79159.1 hypothetical protein AWN68_18000 [Roseivirga echinicomitans]
MLLMVGYDDELNHVFGKIEGALTKDIASSYLSKVAEIAQENKCRKVITDLREAELFANQKEIEILSKELKGIGIEFGLKRAVLISKNINDYKVWENYNFRNGFKDIRLFSDEGVALEWMKL